MAGVVTFMESPLVAWIQTFNESDEAVDFQDLCDGVYLNDVLLQIDQRDLTSDINRHAKDQNAKLQNWGVLLSNMQTFYQDMLQQLVVLKLPDIVAIVKEPAKDCNLKQLRKVLLLLLGCAVQCNRKEDYINRIKLLDLDTQTDMVAHIQEITDDMENIFNLDLNPEVDKATVKSLQTVIRNLVTERDGYSETITLLTQERDYFKAELETKRGPLTAPPNLEKYQLLREVTECRVKVNRLNEEVEDKSKALADLREEHLKTQAELNKIRAENASLTTEARACRNYRDELDMLKEQAVKVDRCEKEIAKYRHKMAELDFYKSRVEELRDDNTLLSEGKMKAETQLSAVQTRVESVMDELVLVQLQLEQMLKDKDSLQGKLQALIEENAALELERNTLKEGGSGGIRNILSYSTSDLLSGSQLQLPGSGGHPISEELNNSCNSQVTRLEMENEGLKEDLKETRKKLADVQNDLDNMKVKSEAEIQKKICEIELQTKDLRRQTSVDMSKEFDQKVLLVKRQSEKKKKKKQKAASATLR